jgi:hypothetical protein
MEKKILSLIRNLKEYGYYKKSSKNASKLLKKAFPALSNEKSLEIIERYSSFYEILNEIIQEEKEIALSLFLENKSNEWIMNKSKSRIIIENKYGLNEEKIILWMGNFIIHWSLVR